MKYFLHRCKSKVFPRHKDCAVREPAIPKLGIQIRNVKMVFNIYGTWHWVTFEKLMMKIYDFFFIRLSRLVALYNNIKKSPATKQLHRIKKNHKFSSLVIQTLPNAKCHKS